MNSVICFVLYIQALYEMAFAFGCITGPFFIYSLRPRVRVPHDITIADVGEPPQVLFVENDSAGIDLLSSENEQVRACVNQTPNMSLVLSTKMKSNVMANV